MKLEEDKSDPGSMTFRWEMIALGGEPADGGLGFANPDNLEIDGNGNLWMVTDMSTSKHNQDPAEIDASPLGRLGNNSAWMIPLSGPEAGNAYPFAIGPMECELCGLVFSTDQKTLLLAAQHPGEAGGMRQNMASDTRNFKLQTPDGQDFMQQRTVPVGSNWPGKTAQDPPKPSLVAVQRVDGKSIT